jgi:Domain of unknown function (DUF4145)
MFKTFADQAKYIKENFVEVTDHRINAGHWDFHCPHCKITRGFQVVRRSAHTTTTVYGRSSTPDLTVPVVYLFRCPVCQAYMQWIIYEIIHKISKKDGEVDAQTNYYKATSVPSDGIEEINELPTEPPSLRSAYRQAVRAMDANAHLAAAAMFRRAVQIITRDLLKVKPGTLAGELAASVGRTYNGAVVGKSFSDVGYIIKEAGNQGAHPDKDPDLLEFTSQDAADLQAIFMELVSDLFVIPAAAKKAKEEFLARRKITGKAM